MRKKSRHGNLKIFDFQRAVTRKVTVQKKNWEKYFFHIFKPIYKISSKSEISMRHRFVDLRWNDPFITFNFMLFQTRFYLNPSIRVNIVKNPGFITIRDLF